HHAQAHGHHARGVEHAAALRVPRRPAALPPARSTALSHGLRLPRPARRKRRSARGPRGLVARLLQRRRRHAQGHAAARHRAAQAPPATTQETPRGTDTRLGLITAYVGIGSNLDDPRQQVAQAFDELSRLPQTSLTARSSLYRTAPLGHAAQPDFINAVAALDTRLS